MSPDEKEQLLAHVREALSLADKYGLDDMAIWLDRALAALDQRASQLPLH